MQAIINTVKLQYPSAFETESPEEKKNNWTFKNTEQVIMLFDSHSADHRLNELIKKQAISLEVSDDSQFL